MPRMMAARTRERDQIGAPARMAGARRPLRWSVPAALAEVWIVVALAGFAAPRLLIAIVPLAVLYTIAAPPYLRRHLGVGGGHPEHDSAPSSRDVHLIIDEPRPADGDIE
jgi:hypothetical protein